MVVSKAGVCLAAALIFAAAGPGFAQSQTQPPPQTPPVAQPPAQPPPQTAPAKPPTQQPQRPTKRQPRTSTRQPSPPGQGSFEEARRSRVAGPTRQDLTFTANLSGGYDDNLTAGLGTGAGTVPTAMASGSTESFDANLGYFRGNTLRSFRMDSTGTLTAYPGLLDHPAAGGAATIGGTTRIGRSLTFGASERVGYEPVFNVFSAGASSAPLPSGIGDTVPANGLFERRSLSSNSSVSMDRWWGRQDSTSLSYSYRVQQFTDRDYGNSIAHDVLAEYRKGLSRGARLRAAYRYVNSEYTASDQALLPTREHRIEGGPEFEKVLSRRRAFTMSLAAGASRIESIGATSRLPYRAWVPIGSASAKLAFSGLWSLDGGYRRDFSQLRGITDEVYTTDTAFLTMGGPVIPRTDLRVGGTYSNWKTPLASGANDRLNVYGASVQLRVDLTRTVAATAGYYYYRHRYSNPGALPVGFPAEYDRNAVRVGLTVWVPLVGTSSRPPLTQR